MDSFSTINLLCSSLWLQSNKSPEGRRWARTKLASSSLSSQQRWSGDGTGSVAQWYYGNFWTLRWYTQVKPLAYYTAIVIDSSFYINYFSKHKRFWYYVGSDARRLSWGQDMASWCVQVGHECSSDVPPSVWEVLRNIHYLLTWCFPEMCLPHLIIDTRATRGTLF